MARIGVFVCHCGTNIAATVDVARVAEEAAKLDQVVYATHYVYMCSTPGQELIQDKIKEHNLDRVVVAACSPRMHERTFRKATSFGGLNPYLMEQANIREHDSWVHAEIPVATDKAIEIVRMAVAKAAGLAPLEAGQVGVTKRCLVIGGGVAGVQAALDVAEAGYETVIVEREPSLGGHMAQLDKTFPTLDCSACLPYEEEIILGDGTFVPIGGLVESFGRGAGHTILSQNEVTCKTAGITDVQKLPAPSHLLEIRTRVGQTLRLTPDHRVLVDTSEGPAWVEARMLTPGLKLYAPHKIRVQSSTVRIVDLLPDSTRVADADLKGQVRCLLVETFGSLERAAHELGIQVRTLYGSKNHLSLGDLRRICAATSLDWEKVAGQLRAFAHPGGQYTQLGTEYVNVDLLYLVGLIASDGSVSSPKAKRLEVQFANTSPALVEMFIDAYRSVFPSRSAAFCRHGDNAQGTSLKNRLLASIVRGLTADNYRPIFKLPEELIAAFLRGYFDGDGSIRIHRSGTSGRIYYHFGYVPEEAEGIHLLLKRLGILANILTYPKRVNLEIARREDILRFIELIGSNHPRKRARMERIAPLLALPVKTRGGLFESLPLECGRLLKSIRARYSIGTTDMPISPPNLRGIERERCRITGPTLRRLVAYLQDRIPPDDKDMATLVKFLGWEFYLDEVAGVQQVPSNGPFVYDVTVAGTHRFIPKGAFVVSNCILTPKLVEASQHPNIKLYTYSEVVEVKGYVGNFQVTIKHKPRYVDPALCTGCGVCWNNCPLRPRTQEDGTTKGGVPSEFEAYMGKRAPIYVPFAQAVPLVPVIDTQTCTWFVKNGKCGLCAQKCPRQAIDYHQTEELVTESFGAIVVATGYDLFDAAVYGEYGYGRYPDVVTGLELERLMNASGPTHGHVLRPSDGKPPKTVVLVSCVGSRDVHVGRPYCSVFCCMYLAKHAIMMKEHDPQVEVYNFYMDIRAAGKDYDEFTRRAIEHYDAHYLRGRVSQVYERGGKLIVEGADTLMGRPVEIAADMVVLATGATAPAGARELFQTLNISYNLYDFINEAHPKLQPVETNSDGIFLCGCAAGPKDIPTSVAQASGAAAKVLGVLSKDALVASPMVAEVNERECVGCNLCVTVCPYKAIELTQTRRGKTVARVNPTVCKGCGLCVNVCRGAAVNLKGFTDQQLVGQVAALFAEPLME